jgi:4-alpha-glucanotransferase
MLPQTSSPPQDYTQALDCAADLWGIEPFYWDIWGRKHVTSAETKKAILNALGVGAETAAQLQQAIHQRLRSEWSRLLPPCLVLSENPRPRDFFVNVPVASAGELGRFEIQREDKQVESFDVFLRDLPDCASAELDGRRYVRKQVPLPLSLPPGYHQLEVSIAGLHDSTRLIIAPDRAYWPPALGDHARAAGIAIHLYGVRSHRNWGCGDFRDLRDLIDWVRDQLKASFIALNPLHAIHNRRPYNTSPYLPNCVFYQNSIYLDVEGIEDFPSSPRARRLWSDPAIRSELEAARKSEYVEYERVCALKLRFLKILFLHFLRHEFRSGTPRALEFLEFLTREGELLDRFALYSALDEYLHKRNPDIWVWPDWPPCFRDPNSPETQQFKKTHWRSVMFYQYVQWQVDRQLAAAQQHARDRGLSIGLYQDLALATDRCGSDLWAYPSFYISGCRVGSPPDDFSPKGQDWAFPPPNFEQHRESGYRFFVESIRKNCRHAGALRIDHVMRFFRLYWIPEGVDATAGAYVRDRSDDLLRIVALESLRNQVIVVGEDLGTVEPEGRETLARFGVLSYRLFYFEKNERGEFKSVEQYPRQAVVSSTTHDLPTLAGFWVNADIESRRQAGAFASEEAYRAQLADRATEKQKILDLLFRLGLLPEYVPRSAAHIPELTGELHNAVIGFLASTPSRLLVINQEDLTKETMQQNLPATTWQYPNWSRKMKFSLERLRSDPAVRDFTTMFRNWLERTGRLNQAVTPGSTEPRG